jgi:hypothetical protein
MISIPDQGFQAISGVSVDDIANFRCTLRGYDPNLGRPNQHR